MKESSSSHVFFTTRRDVFSSLSLSRAYPPFVVVVLVDARQGSSPLSMRTKQKKERKIWRWRGGSGCSRPSHQPPLHLSLRALLHIKKRKEDQKNTKNPSRPRSPRVCVLAWLGGGCVGVRRRNQKRGEGEGKWHSPLPHRKSLSLQPHAPTPRLDEKKDKKKKLPSLSTRPGCTRAGAPPPPGARPARWTRRPAWTASLRTPHPARRGRGGCCGRPSGP